MRAKLLWFSNSSNIRNRLMRQIRGADNSHDSDNCPYFIPTILAKRLVTGGRGGRRSVEKRTLRMWRT